MTSPRRCGAAFGFVALPANTSFLPVGARHALRPRRAGAAARLPPPRLPPPMRRANGGSGGA